TLTRVAAPTRRNGSWAARAAAELGLAVRLARGAARVRPDVVVTSSPSMFLGPAALAAGRRRRRRVVAGRRGLAWAARTADHVARHAPARRRLEEAATNLPNVTFTGYVSPARLVELYHTSDVLFAQLQRSELHRITAAPSKLQEYMAAGRFIVYAGEGSAAEL